MNKEILELLGDVLAEEGIELEGGAEAVAAYARERAALLSASVLEPGFQAAVRAERDNVMLRVAIVATGAADAADAAARAKLAGVLQGTLVFGARLLSGIPIALPPSSDAGAATPT